MLRRERRAQGRTLKDVSEASRISMAYLSEVERGRKEASSEVLAAAAQALGLSLADILALAGERLVSLTAARTRSRSRSLPVGGKQSEGRALLRQDVQAIRAPPNRRPASPPGALAFRNQRPMARTMRAMTARTAQSTVITSRLSTGRGWSWGR
ncbi:hypothetical protein SMICM304S_00085 [Streptomyces microflavus]